MFRVLLRLPKLLRQQSKDKLQQLSIFCAFLAMSTLVSVNRAEAQEMQRPVTCSIGAYVTSIHNIDTIAQTFSADAWVWTICPRGRATPVATMEFTTAQEVDGSLDSALPRGQLIWSQRKITGSFRADYDLRNFPFDRHKLVLGLEEGVDDSSRLRYVLDTKNSGISPAIRDPEWNLGPLKGSLSEVNYPTNFGDPALPPGSASRYSHIDFEVAMERADRTSFFKLAIPAYVATLLALISLLMHAREDEDVLNPRVALLAGSLFAIVFNLRAIDEVVGATPSTTLMDLIHFSSLALVLAVTVYSIAANYVRSRGADLVWLRRADVVAASVGGLFFVVANALLITRGIQNG